MKILNLSALVSLFFLLTHQPIQCFDESTKNFARCAIITVICCCCIVKFSLNCLQSVVKDIIQKNEEKSSLENSKEKEDNHEKYIGDISFLLEQLYDPLVYQQMNIPFTTKCITLYGPENNGKAYLIKNLAENIKCDYFQKTMNNFHELEEILNRIKNYTINTPNYTAVILLKDLIFTSQEKYNNLTNFLHQVTQFGNNSNILIALTINSESSDFIPQSNDTFECINIGYPNEKKRRELIAYFSEITPTNKEININLLKITDGFTSGKIKKLFDIAGIIAIRKKLKKRDTDCFAQAYQSIIKQRVPDAKLLTYSTHIAS